MDHELHLTPISQATEQSGIACVEGSVPGSNTNTQLCVRLELLGTN